MLYKRVFINGKCLAKIVFSGKFKVLRTIVAMLTEHKNTEIFFMADDFCKFFDVMMLKYVLKSNKKRIFYCEIKMSKDKNIKFISQTSNGFITLNHENRGDNNSR